MEYLEAFERAIIYMEAHLDEAISVHEVAKASGYSYYHFTRIFQSVLGESIGNYLQKRRLSNLAKSWVLGIWFPHHNFITGLTG